MNSADILGGTYIIIIRVGEITFSEEHIDSGLIGDPQSINPPNPKSQCVNFHPANFSTMDIKARTNLSKHEFSRAEFR